MDPNVIAVETRKVEAVTVGGHSHTLWVAPTRSGGLCYVWTNLGGGCDRLGTVPLDVVWAGGGAVPVGSDGLPDINAEAFGRISVHVSAAYVDRVAIRFADGTTVQPEITWVSAPIDAGFFLYSFSREQQRPGHQVVSVVALKSGDVITEEPASGTAQRPVAPPADAIVSQRTVAFSAPTSRGNALIWTAPTRYDGKCAWLEFEGKLASIAPCQPKGYDWNEGLATGFYPTSDAVLFFGTAERYEQIDLVYEDGGVTHVIPKNHVFVASIPDRHFEAGHQVERIDARGPDGRVIPSASYSPRHDSPSGCAQVVPSLACGR